MDAKPTPPAEDPSQYSKMNLVAKHALSTPSDKVFKLLSTGRRIVTNTDFAPKDGKTFCNWALDAGCREFGFVFKRDKNNEPPLMNDMLNLISRDTRWRAGTSTDAYEWALAGNLAIAGWINPAGHGHGAILAPLPRTWSNKWSEYCPLVFNVGETMNTEKPYALGENQAFIYRPSHFLYVPAA